MTVREALMQTRELLAPEGAWCQGVAADTHGARCLVGALTDATGRERDGQAYLDARDAIARCLWRTAVWSITGWNDWPGRTQAEVLGLLDKAIAAEPKP